MNLKVVDKRLLLDYLSALGYVKSAGYELILNGIGTKSAVMDADQTINVVAQTMSLRNEGSLSDLILRIADMKLFKKFIKLVEDDRPDVSYDQSINTLQYGEHLLNLNAKEFKSGYYKSNNGFERTGYFLAKIPDNNALFEVLSNAKHGEMLEVRSNRLVMGSWDMEVDISDSAGAKLDPDFCIKTYRVAMKNISRIHKKVGQGDLHIRIFKEQVPAMICHGAVSCAYRAYCGIMCEPVFSIKKDEVKNG